MVEIESIRVLGIHNDDLTHDLLTVKQGAAGKLDCFIDEDNTNIRYVLKSQVLAMRRKVRGE